MYINFNIYFYENKYYNKEIILKLNIFCVWKIKIFNNITVYNGILSPIDFYKGGVKIPLIIKI